MQDKCYIARRRPVGRQKDRWTNVKVSAEHYNQICDLCSDTGMSIASTVDKLLAFALDRVELIDEEGDENNAVD